TYVCLFCLLRVSFSQKLFNLQLAGHVSRSRLWRPKFCQGVSPNPKLLCLRNFRGVASLFSVSHKFRSDPSQALIHFNSFNNSSSRSQSTAPLLHSLSSFLTTIQTTYSRWPNPLEHPAARAQSATSAQRSLNQSHS